MYAELHETVPLPVGLELAPGHVLHQLTLRPIIVADMARVAELAGDTPSLMDIDLARWTCQIVREGDDEAPTMDQLRRLTEPDYQALSDAADRVKKKRLTAPAG